ncbi:MAG: oligopeptide/dipeptide ABC transporter ATP-binding protein [Promethearchaeota archaeon]
MILFETVFSLIIILFIAKFVNRPLLQENQVSIKEKNLTFITSCFLILIIILTLRYTLGILGYFIENFQIFGSGESQSFELLGFLFFAIMVTLFFPINRFVCMKICKNLPSEDIEISSRIYIKRSVLIIGISWIVASVFLSIDILDIQIGHLVPPDTLSPDYDNFLLGFEWAFLVVMIDIGITNLINRTLSIEKRLSREELNNSMILAGIISFFIWSIQLIIVELYLGRFFGIYLSIGGILIGVGMFLIICVVGIFIYAPELLPKKTVLMVVFLIIGAILSIISETFHLFLIGVGIFFIIWVVGIFIYGPELLPINTVLKIVFLIIGAILSIISGTFRLFLNILNAKYIQDIRILFGVVSLIYGIIFFISLKKIFMPKAMEMSNLKLQKAFELEKEQTMQKFMPEGNHAILEVKDLTTYFYTEEGVVRAVEGISFKIYKGEVLGLVGETGCGKSVTALSILNLIRPPGVIVRGSIKFLEKELQKKGKTEILPYRGKDITMIFQDPLNSLNPIFKVGNQISEVYLLHKRNELLVEASKDYNKSIYSVARVWSQQLLKELNIPAPEKIFDRYPHELSGGMRQRIQIAMALACSPKLLIADEPTTALDVTVQNQILKLMKDLKSIYNTSILFITHDLGIISKMCDRVAVMYSGSIVEYGKITQLFTHPYHPYTRGLIASVPIVGKRKERLAIIQGTVPNLIYPPTGCKFHPRCEYRFEPCDKTIPKNIEVEPEYFVGCHLYDAQYRDLAELVIKRVDSKI